MTDEIAPTRSSLLTRLKDWEDREGWQEFFDMYWRLIYSSARKAGLSNAEAEDVVQETVISVCKAMPMFEYDRHIGSFKSWLLRITSWRIVDQLRRRPRQTLRRQVAMAVRRRGDRSETATSEPHGVADFSYPNMERIWEEEWGKNMVDVAISRIKHRIDPKHFQIFHLVVLEEWPIKKVAIFLGVSSARIYLIKHRISGLITAEITRLQKAVGVRL